MTNDDRIKLNISNNFGVEMSVDFETSLPDVGYIRLQGHSVSLECGIVKKQLRLFDLVGNYEGPDIHLDFDKDNRLIGIDLDFPE